MWWLWPLLILVFIFSIVVFRGAPYVPSRRRELVGAFEQLYPLSHTDVLVDIGSGDGVVLREAVKYGAKAIGYELNPILVLIARLLSRTQPLVTVRLADFWLVQLPQETTVVYVFGESRDIAKMAKKVETEARRLNKQLALISYGIAVPSIKPIKKFRAYYLYQFSPLQSEEA